MKRVFVGACTVALLAACAGVGTYPTHVAIGQSAAVFGQIGPLAAAEGHKMYSGDQSLEVEFDSATKIIYQADPAMTGGPNIVIGVAVTNSELPPPEVQTKMNAASQKAYEWLEKAQASLASAPAPVATGVATPAMAASVSMNVNINAQVDGPGMAAPAERPSGSCQKLLACHAGLASTFCQAGGAECQFKIEISGMDDEGCKMALADIPELVQPFSMAVPGFAMPAACH